jgi:SAM-dependent methyltransferase
VSGPTASDLVDLQTTLYTSQNPTRRWLHSMRRDWIVGAIQRYSAGTGGTAIEIGPGSGVYLPELLSRFHRVFVADIERAFLEQSRRICPDEERLTVEVDDITRTRLPADTFDLVLCSEVVEHISDSKSAIVGMSRILRPGGVLILSTPHRFSTLEVTARIALKPPMIHLVGLVYREPVLELGHINLLTRRQLEAQLHAAGFEILERHCCGLYLPLLAEIGGNLALRLEQYLQDQLRGGPLEQLLWTQFYVCRKPTDAAPAAART